MYEPELGQYIYGQPYQAFDVPEYLEAALSYLQQEIERVEWNNGQKDFNPFGNTGQKYRTKAFEVEAYSWDDSIEQPYNFKWKDLELSWYKWFGRGMSMNRETTPDEVAVMLDECLKSVRDNEKPLIDDVNRENV